nr:pyruvate kinase-like isoform X5 [Populus alba]
MQKMFVILTYFDESLQEADGVILSRGNLGIDLPPEKVFLFQKTVVFKCNMAGKPAVVTLVVDSMTENLRPPRAEATDVANAILDGSNAILLGAETLRGLYPVETFSTVGRICAEAFSLLNESPRIQTMVAALASDPNVWNAVWENKALQELLQSQNANKEYVADNESVGDTDSQDAAVSSKKLTELSDDENETGNSQTGLMDVINNVKLTVVDMVTNVSAYFKKIFSFSSAEHTPDAADEKAGSSTTEKTLGASLMALAVMVIMVVVLRRP